MSLMVSPESLRRFEFFASLDEKVLRELAMVGETLEIPAQQVMFSEGEVANGLYILQRGSVVILVSAGGPSMREFGILKLTRGEIFGWSSLVEPYRYHLSARTMTPCQLVRFDGTAVCEIMTHHPHFGYIMMTRVAQIIGERLVNLRRQLVSLVEGERFELLVGKDPYYLFEGGRSVPLEG